MDKEILHSRYDDHPENVESDDELNAYLSRIAEEIGWIIIYFNSLEDLIAHFLREMMLRDPSQDERLDVFITEMGYQSKARALIHLYGQTAACGISSLPENELVTLEKALTLAATIRNGYAHADWMGLRTKEYVRVKSRSSRSGIFHRYKRIDVSTAKLDAGFILSLRDRLSAVHDLIQDHMYQRANSPVENKRELPEIAYPTVDPNGKLPLSENQIDVMNALLVLGYPDNEALSTAKQIPPTLPLRDGMKHALKLLQSSR